MPFAYSWVGLGVLDTEGRDVTGGRRDCPVCTWVLCCCFGCYGNQRRALNVSLLPHVLPPCELLCVSAVFIWDGTFHRQVPWARLDLGRTITVTFLGDSRMAKCGKQPQLSAWLASGTQLPKALIGPDMFIASPFLSKFA